MATKKSGESWKEAEHWGPYQIHEQVPQAPDDRESLFRATHEESGVTALVLKPVAEGSVPLPDWEVRCISSNAPRYLAMEVTRSPWSFASDRHSVEELLFMFDGLRAGVLHMARHMPFSEEPASWRHWGRVFAGAAAMCALVVALVLWVRVSLSPSAPTAHREVPPASLSSGAPTDIVTPSGTSLMDNDAGWPAGLFHPMPNQPFKGQKRPPCNPRVEVEINGGCWVPHELKAPCPEELYEHQGKCYTAGFSAQPLPRSLGQ